MYMFPFNVIHWAKTVLLCGMMSVFIGGIFIGIRFKYFEQKDSEYEQDNINDRLGFHHCIMAVGIWPMLLSMISEAWREKRPVTRDVEDGLYSKLVYIMTKVSTVHKYIRILYKKFVKLQEGIFFPNWARCNISHKSKLKSLPTFKI